MNRHKNIQSKHAWLNKLFATCRGLSFLMMLLSAAIVQADCVADISASDASASYVRAGEFETAGKLWEAINAYERAQGYVCDQGGNPVAKQALAKAIALGTKEGERAEQAANYFNDGRSKGAFQWYQKAAQFQAADRVLMAALEKSPNDFALVGIAIEHFYQRGQAYFITNNRAAITATGGYQLNGRYATYVGGLPAINIERMLATYKSILPDEYLISLVDLEFKKETLVPGDMRTMLQIQQAFSAMQQHWQSDRLVDARKLFEEAQRWAQLLRDNQARAKQLAIVAQAQLAHADRLVAHYGASVSLLGAALDIYRTQEKSLQVKQVQQQARKYADKALAEKQFERASNLYLLAGDEAKAQQVRVQLDAQSEQLSQGLQADASAQVAAMQAIYSDPEKLKELQRQALLLQQQMQQARQNKSAQQEQDQLETDLGL